MVARNKAKKTKKAKGTMAKRNLRTNSPARTWTPTFAGSWAALFEATSSVGHQPFTASFVDRRCCSIEHHDLVTGLADKTKTPR